MMGKMRDYTKWILYILIVAFVGLMVVEWGADYSGISRRSQFVVGEVSGQEITLDQFNQAFRFARYNEEQRSGKNLSEEQIDQLREQVWEEMVQRILLHKEIEKLDVQVTSEDVTSYVRGMLYQQYRDDPNFQTDGQFDQGKFDQILADESNRSQLLMMEAQAKENLPYTKLADIIGSSVIVTEEEIRAEYMQQNVKAKIEYLAVPVGAFRDAELEVSDKEVLEYYNKNKEDFKTQEARQLNYVYFSTIPTPADTARIYQHAEEIKAEALEGKDFDALADAESADPSVTNNHGDLGFFERKDMVPAFSDAAFAASPGNIVGPVKTQFGLHIIKVHDKKTENGVEKVHASHILLKFEPGYNTLDDARRNAELFSEMVQEVGFSITADTLSVEVRQTPEFSDNKFGQIPGVGRLQSGLRWAFNSLKDAVSEVYYTPEGNYIFQLNGIKSAGYRPFEEVKEICKNRVEIQKRKELARGYAEKTMPKVEQNDNFREIARADTSNILEADSTDYFPMNIFIPKIGRAPAITANAFNLPLNETSGMLETDRGFYFIRVTDRPPFNQEDYANQRESIRNRLMQQKSRNVFNQWYENLKEDANIVDNRYRFFRG
jgi:peptidylprolyl isomerase/peptidyl-prolyl cis-trans isomerase D